MKRLKDYSGEFLPNLKPGDFSHTTLAELLKLYGRLYAALDGFWYLSVKEKLGNEAALACDIRVWEMVCKYEMAKIVKQLNIQGNDIIAFMKAMQVVPWYQNTKYKIEIESKSRARFIVTHCRTLDALEREGGGREEEICGRVGAKTFEDYAAFFNPDIEVRCLKLPPRKSKDEICCQWEFEIESQGE